MNDLLFIDMFNLLFLVVRSYVLFSLREKIDRFLSDIREDFGISGYFVRWRRTVSMYPDRK